jgi:hypothetical protein
MVDNTQKPKGSFAKLMSSQASSSEPRGTKTLPLQHPTRQEVDQSINQSTDQSIDQSTNQSSNPPLPPSSAIVDRPKAFYITERLDRDLDTAVRYFQEVHGIKKADRSTVVNALLDNEANWTPQSMDQLVDRLISQLTSRLTSRPTGK